MATNSKQVKPLDIPFKEFTPGQVIQSVQFNDDMLDIEDKVNELVNEHNIVSDEVDSHTSNLDNPHQVDAHQTGTYYASEIDEFFQDIKSGNLNDNAITNRVLDDDCVTGRNIEDNTITVSKVDSMLGSQLDISQNIEIATRYTKEETDNLIQDKVGNGTYSKEELDVKFEEVQAGVIVDSIIGIEKLKEDVGTKLNIGSNINILNKYTKDEVDYLIRCNALPRDWGSILGDDEVEPFFDTKNGIFPVADFMIADKFVTSNDNILDFEIREVVDSRGEYETLNDRLNVYDTIKPEINEELEVISNKINDNQNINNEEHNTINSKVLDNINSISSLNSKVSNLENTTSTQGNKISSLERRSDTLESRATALESADRGINVKISNVENRLGSIDSLNNTQTSKINALENRANTTDTNISNINSNINSVKTDLNNVKSDLNTVKTDLNNVGQIVNENIEPIRTELSQVVSKNNEQDNRLNSLENDLNGLPDVISNHNDLLNKHESDIKDIKYVNKRQDVMLGGLFNENADGRLNIDGTGNDVKLEGSKDGLVEVKNVVGNTMVNVCDQKDPVAITKSYTVESGNHVALQGDYDGKCRPVVYGNTLVNLFKSNYKYSQGGNVTFWVDLDISLLKDNTLYTIIPMANSKLTKMTLKGAFNYIDLATTTFTITDRSLNDNLFYIYSDENINIEDVQTSKFMILEGDYTNKPIPDYFEGIQSSFEDKLVTQEMVDSGEELAENLGKYRVDYKVTGKNKFDEHDKLIKIKPNTNYFISSSETAGATRIRFNLYDINMNEVKDINTSGVYYNTGGNCYMTNGDATKISFPIITKASYIKLYYYNTVPYDNLQLEEGSTATTYEPYKEQVKTYYLNSPLLEGDTIEDNGNDVVHVHRYDSVTFDGSGDDEGWISSFAGTNESLNSFYIADTGGVPSINTAICDKMKPKTAWDVAEEGIWFDQNCYITISKSIAGDVSEFKSFLASNPITVVYELALPTKEVISTNDSILQDSYVGGSLDVDTAVPIDKVEFRNVEIYNKYIYPSTKYIIQFEADNSGILNMIGLSGSKVFSQNVVKGLNKINITTLDTVNHTALETNGIGFSASNIVVTEATDKDFGYFEGMKSSFEDKVTEDGKYAVEVKVVGKNKFNKEKAVDQTKTGLIKVEPNTTYYIKVSNIMPNGALAWLREYDYCGNITVSTLWDNKFTTKSNTVKVDFSSTANLIDGFMLCLDESTEYEPYKEYVQTLYLDEPLYKDNELCVHDGKLGYWKNREKVVLNGSEPSLLDNSKFYPSDTTRMYRFGRPSDNIKTGGSPLCDKFADVLITTLLDTEGILQSVGGDYGAIYFRILNNKLKTQDLAGFKEWLKDNPTTLVYELAEPYFVPILENTPQWVLESFNDCSIHFNSNIPITSSNLSYTGNVPSVYSMQRTNQIQDDLIDVSLMATDEMFMMLEPLLSAIPQLLNEKGCSKMVDMYVAMVMRGLKTIEEVPVRYREEVKKVLDKLEK